MDEGTPPQRDEIKDDETRRSQPRIVKPMEEKEELFTFGSTATWGEQELRLLNVNVMKDSGAPLRFGYNGFRTSGVGFTPRV